MCTNIDLNIFISVGVASNPLPSCHRSFSVTLSHRIIGHFRIPADLDRLPLNYHSGCGDVSPGLRTGSAIISSEKLDQKYKQGKAHNKKKQYAGYSKLSLALCHRHTLWVFSSKSHRPNHFEPWSICRHSDSEQRAVNSCCGSMIVLWPEGTVKHRVMNPVSSKTAALKLHVCYKGPKYI